MHTYTVTHVRRERVNALPYSREYVSVIFTYLRHTYFKLTATDGLW